MEEKTNLSIYIFKTKEKYGNSWDEQTNHDRDTFISNFNKKYEKAIKTLSKAPNEDYEDVYTKVVTKLSKDLRFAYQTLIGIGLNSDGSVTPRTFDDFKGHKDEIVSNLKFVAELEFVGDTNFNSLFKKYYKKSRMFWLTDEIVDDLLATCNIAGKGKKNARATIPTNDGKYTDDYFDRLRAFRLKLKHIKGLLKKGYLVYAAAIEQ